MAEYIAPLVQEVEPGQNILFTGTTICGSNSIMHREGSGLVSLRGITNTQCRARFRVTFGGNIAIPTGGTVDAISVSFSISGEPIDSSTMIVTPAAVEEFFNVGRTMHIDIPAGCCTQIAVKNTSTQTISVQNANLIVERVA